MKKNSIRFKTVTRPKVITFKLSQDEFDYLRSAGSKWPGGVSGLIRSALDSFLSDKNKKK